MASGYYDLETLKRQFHSRSVSYNRFKNITEQDIERIKGKVDQMNKSLPKTSQSRENDGLDRYIKSLRFLISPTVYLDYKTFDEKILHLILAVDPDFVTYKSFLTSDITTLEEIDKAEDVKEKKRLQERRRIGLDIFETNVRKQIGVYDPNFLKYERLLTLTLFKTEGFVSDIKVRSLPQLIKKAELVKDIKPVTHLDLARLKQIAQRWGIEAKDPKDLNSLAYNILCKFKDLKLRNIPEQIILFILIADPNLDLLRIFEEESTYPKMEERAKTELGFYGQGLINVEKQYHDKFEPEKQISAWTK